MATTPLTGIPYPVLGDGPVDGPAVFRAFLEHQERYSVMRFASAAARDTALPTPAAGMVAYLSDVKAWFSHNGTSWLPMFETDKPLMVAYFNAAGDLLMDGTQKLLTPLAAETSHGITIVLSSRVTINRTGLYRVAAQVRFHSGTSDGAAQVVMRKNSAGDPTLGATVAAGYTPTQTFANATAHITPKFAALAAGDYLELFVQGTGSSEARPAAAATYLTVEWVEP